MAPSGDSAVAKSGLDQTVDDHRNAFLDSDRGAERLADAAPVLRAEKPGMSEAQAIHKTVRAATGAGVIDGVA